MGFNSSQEDSRGGFIVGVAVGAAIATVVLADPQTRRKAKAKVDQVLGDYAPELVDTAKTVVTQIIDYLKGDEPAKPKRRVARSKKTSKPTKRR